MDRRFMMISVGSSSASPTPAVKPYLTFSSPNSFTLATANTTANWDGTIEYSTNKTTWSTWDGTSISSASDGTNHNIYLRGTGNTYITGETSGKSFTFPTGSSISCSGNIENLLDYATVTQNNHPTMAAHCFRRLFQNCTQLISAPDLLAETLTMFCYGSMFYNTGIISAPTLPATTLAGSCYRYMFNGCSSLTTAPALPATSLQEYCYGSMFSGCTSLTTLPALPATSLGQSCYSSMFNGCTQIKLSETQTGEYVNTYRIPSTGTGNASFNWNASMFDGTGGTFTGNPSINTTYYTSNTVV